MPFSQPWLEVNFGTAYAGLVGTVGYRLYQADDSDSIARTTASIVEVGTNTGCYGVVPPSIPDNAVGIEWDTGGGTPVSATEDLEPYRRRAVVEGKLPTNFIMGSSTQSDKDDEIDTILSDTNDIQTRLPAALVGGAMDSDVSNMQSNVVDADALATDAAQEIRDEILADSTPFNGADIDQSLSTTESNIRGADSDDLKDISDQIDAVPVDVDTELTANHGAGSWQSATSVDWTAGEKEQIRSVLGVDGAKTEAVDGQFQQFMVAQFATVGASSTAQEVRTDLTQADGFWRNMVMVVENTGGTGERVARNIDRYTQSNGALYTYEGLPWTPQAGDKVFLAARTGSLRDDRSPVIF